MRYRSNKRPFNLQNLYIARSILIQILFSKKEETTKTEPALRDIMSHKFPTWVCPLTSTDTFLDCLSDPGSPTTSTVMGHSGSASDPVAVPPRLFISVSELNSDSDLGQPTVARLNKLQQCECVILIATTTHRSHFHRTI